jgi:OFA family oxalate/formate antiporter-like MFS transporter
MFYLNITCGLALISQEKDILKIILDNIGYEKTVALSIIAIVLSFNAAFNALGRIGYSTISDKMKYRENAYRILFSISAVVCFISYFSSSAEGGTTISFIIVLLLLFMVNAGYGGGFSTLPVLLQEHFGMEKISTVHGLALSAWAIAGLSGNQLASFIINTLHLGYSSVIFVIGFGYIIAFIIVSAIKRKANYSSSVAFSDSTDSSSS